jgi:hypothetical protein
MRKKLSPNFTLGEMLVSATAARMGRTISWQDLTPEVERNLTWLCHNLLEPIRKHFRKPVVVISGYRPLWLNKAVGGSKTSDHMQGGAADIIVPGIRNVDVCHWVALEQLPYKQLIHEFPPDGWVHISGYEGTDPIRQMLTAVKQNRRTIYLNGILS